MITARIPRLQTVLTLRDRLTDGLEDLAGDVPFEHGFRLLQAAELLTNEPWPTKGTLMTVEYVLAEVLDVVEDS